MTFTNATRLLMLLCLLICWQTTLLTAKDNDTKPGQTANAAKIKNDEQTPAENAEAADAEQTEEQEVNITAERMEMQLEKHQIELSGNVMIEDETMKLTAQKMTIFLDNDNKMEHIEAEGLVTVRKLDSSESAVGDRGTYDAKNDVIILTGNCTILQGKNAMVGEKVVYDRKKQTINLHGATITLPLKKTDGKGGGSMMGNLFGGDKTESDQKTDQKTDQKPDSTDGTGQNKDKTAATRKEAKKE